MFTPSIGELIVILVIILIIFGVGKLPEVGKGLGKGIKEFKKASKNTGEIDVTPSDKDSEAANQEQIQEKSSDS